MDVHALMETGMDPVKIGLTENEKGLKGYSFQGGFV